MAQFVAEYVCLGLGLGLPIDALRTSPHLLALNKVSTANLALGTCFLPFLRYLCICSSGQSGRCCSVGFVSIYVQMRGYRLYVSLCTTWTPQEGNPFRPGNRCGPRLRLFAVRHCGLQSGQQNLLLGLSSARAILP